ncbi:MAG: hypothetical protein ABSG78_25390 [Verrucomicrobiota bacterium]
MKAINNTMTDACSRMPANKLPAAGAHDQALELTQVVAAAVRNLDEHSLNPLPGPRGSSVTDAKRLLSLLCWSYARQIYSSAEIHFRLRGTPTAGLWDSGAPATADICRFRQENRSVLQACLGAVLRFLVAQKVAEGFVTRINESHIAEEASRRIIMAMFIDSVESTHAKVPRVCDRKVTWRGVRRRRGF